MALIKCKECGTEYSDNAPACIKCGNPNVKPTSARQVISGAIWTVLMLAGLAAWVSSCNKEGKNPSPPAAAEKVCGKDELQCLGDKGIVGAGIYCKSEIEKRSLHDVKWTDGYLETKFSRFRWKNKELGIITYIGDKVEFQNGFGAYTPVTYECDMLPDNKTIIDVRLHEGRME